MANGVLHAQDYELTSCKIISALGSPIELMPSLMEFNYYEDIFGNCVTGVLHINDSMNFVQTLQLQGQDILVLSFDKPGSGIPIEKHCIVYKVGNRTRTKAMNENYSLYFCSEEFFLNEQYRISKSYQDTKIVDIVKDIALNGLKIDPKKLVALDDTSGLRSLVIPNYRPLQAINWACTFALSTDKKNVGAPFLFYETRDGYFFKSILNLFQQPIYKQYNFEEKNLKSDQNDMVSDINKEFVNVLAFEQIESFDSLNAIRNGVLANKTHTVDPLRLKFGEVTYDYAQYIKHAASMDKGAIPTTAANRFGQKINETAGNIKFCVSTTGQSENLYVKNKKVTINENLVEQTTSYRDTQLLLLTSNRIRILVPGDIGLSVGKVIDFNMPELVYNNTTRQKEPDKFYSGKYLISGLRHIISEGKFTTSLELCKESFSSNFAAFDNKDTGWKGIR